MGITSRRSSGIRLTNLFAEDGTIEIALRGVYVGKAAVRRNLNLYGQQGLDNGVLHNHMQFQPVIHVAADGRTAKMRSRAFSMMGNFKQNSMWMGGVYENDFVKVDGEWKFKKDQVMNTYCALRRGLEDARLHDLRLASRLRIRRIGRRRFTSTCFRSRFFRRFTITRIR